MTLSVVMVTYNSADCIAAALRAVHEHLPMAETIVVDNASTDETLETVAAVSPATKILSGHGNVGFGEGCNRGAAAAANSHVLFMNPDVRVAAADIAGLETLFSVEPFGLVAPLLAADGTQPPRHQVFRERHWVLESLDHVVGGLWPRGWRRRRPFADSTDGGWASGAALLVRRTEFESAGPFDKRLFLFYEDRDLAMSYRKAGLPIRTTAAIIGQHAGGGSSGTDGLEARRLAFAILGWVEYLAKWHGEPRACRAAELMIRALVAVHCFTAVVAGVGGPARVVRKREQLGALRRLLAGEGLELAPERYGRARRLLAKSPRGRG